MQITFDLMTKLQIKNFKVNQITNCILGVVSPFSIGLPCAQPHRRWPAAKTVQTRSSASADRTARPSWVFSVLDEIFQVSVYMQIKTGVQSAVQQ